MFLSAATEIKDLLIEDSFFGGASDGAIVNKANGGKITNCVNDSVIDKYSSRFCDLYNRSLKLYQNVYSKEELREG